MLQALAGDPTITAHAAVRPPLLAPPPRSVCRHRRGQDADRVQVRLGRVLRRARHSHRARSPVHGGRTRRPSGGHCLGVGRACPLAEWRWRRRDVPARAGSHVLGRRYGSRDQSRDAAERRRADDAAHGHGRRRLTRRRGLSLHRRQGCGCVSADQPRGREDLGRRSRSRRSRFGPANAHRASHQDRSEHGHDRDHADGGEARNVLPRRSRSGWR